MKYSIITVNLNNREGLRNTINSVINQDYSDYEFIIIDGGSTDGSKDVCHEFSSQITYWISEKDNGIYNGMNKGIIKARGEFVNFMNSGDTFYDNHVLSNVSKMMDGSDIVVGCDFNQSPITGETFTSILPTRISMATFFTQSLPHQSSFIRRSLFDNSLYDEKLKIVSDWKFFMNKIVFENATVQLINNLIISRHEQDGLSAYGAEKVAIEREKTLKELLPYSIYKDYEALANLDRSTLYKLLNLLDKKPNKLLTYCIKIIYRINRDKNIEII